eukprot:1050195_1
MSTFLLFLILRTQLSLGSLGDIKDANDNGKFAYDVSTYCKASGLSNCPTKVALCTGYQYFISPIISKHLIASTLSDLAAAVNSYCLGEPSLKCCMVQGDKGNCWSAFNQPAPINCEGNPSYGATETVGDCLAPCDGCAGCLCDYLAACNLNRRRRSLLAQTAYNTNYWKLGRMASVYWLITQAMNNQPVLNDNPEICSCRDTNPDTMHCVSSFAEEDEMLCQTPGTNSLVFHTIARLTKQQQILDFIEWRGCEHWLFNKGRLIDNLPHNYTLKNWNGDDITRTHDIFDDVIPIRFAVPYYALIRYAIDIPQFWVKVDWVLGNTWTNITRNELLLNHSIDSPGHELLKYIDYGGLLLLQDIFGDDWSLFAIHEIGDEVLVSMNYSSAPPTPSYIPGQDLYQCQLDNGRGTAAIIKDDLVLSFVDDSLVLHFNVDDTTQQSNEVITKIYWGDSSNIEEYIVNGDTNNYEYSVNISHTYDCCDLQGNDPQIRIQVMNDAGLYSFYRQTVYSSGCKEWTACNPDHVISASYSDIDTVAITMELERGGNINGDAGTQIFYFEAATQDMFVNDTNWQDMNNDFSDLGSWMWTDGVNNETAPINITLDAFKWSLASNIKFIRFTCRTFNHYVYSFINARIVGLTLTLFSGRSMHLNIGQNDFIQCSRRGNVYEDDQQLSVVRLNPFNLTSNDKNDTYDYGDYELDGWYHEVLPGQYVYNELPTSSPTSIPSVTPTDIPSMTPTDIPSITPTDVPSITPTNIPSILPTDVPSIKPTDIPSVSTTEIPLHDDNANQLNIIVSTVYLIIMVSISL